VELEVETGNSAGNCGLWIVDCGFFIFIFIYLFIYLFILQDGLCLFPPHFTGPTSSATNSFILFLFYQLCLYDTKKKKKKETLQSICGGLAGTSQQLSSQSLRARSLCLFMLITKEKH